jgi:hypothetical protein
MWQQISCRGFLVSPLIPMALVESLKMHERFRHIFAKDQLTESAILQSARLATENSVDKIRENCVKGSKSKNLPKEQIIARSATI